MPTTEEAVGHEAFDLEHEEMVVEVLQAVGGVLLEAVAVHPTAGGKVDEIVKDGKRVVDLQIGVEVGDAGVGAVKVGPYLWKLVDDALAAALLVELGGRGGVDGYEDVGHDATTAIDGTTTGGLILERVGQVDGVGAEELAVLIAAAVLVVVLVAALSVGALDAASGRGEVASCGEAYLAAVGKGVHGLHKPFAVAAPPDKSAAVPILYGTADNLGGRGGLLVDEHHERAFAEVAPAVGAEVLTWAYATFLVDNQLAVGEELVGKSAGYVEESATVAAEVENECLHALALQLAHRLAKLVDRVAGKALEGDVADGVVLHEVDIDRVDGYLVALDVEGEGVGAAEHVDHHYGAFFATQVTECEGVVGTVACGGDAVDTDKLVAGQHAYFFSGAAGNDLGDADGVGHYGEGDTHTLEVALQGFVGALDILGGDVDAMGVERAEHGTDGCFAEGIGVGVDNVVFLYERHHLLQSLSAGDGVDDRGFFLKERMFACLCRDGQRKEGEDEC